MQSQKTHAQHLRLVEKQQETGNACPEFGIKGDLARSDSAKHVLAEGTALRSGLKDLIADHGMIRGFNQESQHHKRSGN